LLFLHTLDGALHRAPLAKDITAALDVGTGSGIWPIEFATQHPDAQVMGIDLSPVVPGYCPPNCRFYVENAEDEWEYDTKFDFIHGRMLVVGIRNWRRFFEQAYANLKPGGWIEMQDLNFPVRCDDGTAAPDSPVMEWSADMVAGAAKFGIDLQGSRNFASLLADAGFTDINSEAHAWPINPWPKEHAMKIRGAWSQENFSKGVQGFSMAFFTRGVGWSKDKVDEIVERVRGQVADKKSHAYLPIVVFWARKPETAGNGDAA